MFTLVGICRRDLKSEVGIISKFYKMKKNVVLLVSMLLYSIAISQTTDAEFKVYKHSFKDTEDFFATQKNNDEDDVFFKISYRKMNFLNPTYNKHIKNKTISYVWGGDVGMVYPFYPFMIDAGFMFSRFNVDEDIVYYPDNLNKKTMFYGIYFSFSIFPLPDMNRISEVFRPYLGIGYQTSSLQVIDKDREEDKEFAYYGLGSANWKIGLFINVFGFAINGEYRQGLNMNNPKNFSEWTTGIVIKI